jgi:D-glycero-D-manno-heptose 1,7-bisphosphate phosphatase
VADMGALLGPDGLWVEVFSHAKRAGPALFLDRDGVIVEEVEYLGRIEDIRMIPGAATVIAAANRLEIPVVVATNQAGIGRGYYDWPQFAAVQQAIQSALAREGARIDAVYACAHLPVGKGTYAHPDHPSRKPNPGMLLRAGNDLSLDLGRSWLIGDNVTDIEAARRASLAGALLVATGHGQRSHVAAVALANSAFEVRTGRSIRDASALPLLSRP